MTPIRQNHGSFFVEMTGEILIVDDQWLSKIIRVLPLGMRIIPPVPRLVDLNDMLIQSGSPNLLAYREIISEAAVGRDRALCWSCRPVRGRSAILINAMPVETGGFIA